MPDGVERLEKRAQTAIDRTLKRFEDRFDKVFNRTFGSTLMAPEQRGQFWLTMAGDPAKMTQWAQEQAQTHGWPMAKTMFMQMYKDGEKQVEKLVEDGKRGSGENAG